MKNIIIYYSISGNTRKIAQAIHKGMSRIADQCDIVAIKGTQGVPGMHMGHLLEYDLIGIGSPVIAGSLAPNMMNFIDAFPTEYKTHLFKTGFEKHPTAENKKHAFVFITHGLHPGDAMRRAWAALQKKDLKIVGYKDWYGVAAGTYLAQPHFAEGHPDNIDLKEAEDFGRELAERSHRIFQGETALIPKLPTGEEYRKLYGDFPKPEEFPNFMHHEYGIRIDREKCNRCCLCVEHCPMDAIDLDADPPILANCSWCILCEMVCPKGAVDIGIERIKRDRGEKPSKEFIKWAVDLHSKIQNQLQPKQRLRMLVPMEEVYTKYYVYDVTTHPRIVIPEQGWKGRHSCK